MKELKVDVMYQVFAALTGIKGQKFCGSSWKVGTLISVVFRYTDISVSLSMSIYVLNIIRHCLPVTNLSAGVCPGWEWEKGGKFNRKWKKEGRLRENLIYKSQIIS